MRLTRRSMIAGLALSGCAARSPVRGTLTFRTEDGVRVSGYSYGGGRHGVVLAPGAHGVGETWDMQAQKLARAGFRVLAMDYRGLGRSHDVPQDSDRAHLDILGAARQLGMEGADRVSIVGASWGGWAAATAAIAAPHRFDRVVLLAHSAFETPERLTARKLFIVAKEDRDGSGRPRLDYIRDQYARAPKPKELVVLDGAAHAQFLFLTPQGDRLYAEIERFLSAP